jgi:hypothetical protein
MGEMADALLGDILECDEAWDAEVGSQDPIRLRARCYADTEKAILVKLKRPAPELGPILSEPPVEIWIPRSLLRASTTVHQYGDVGTVVVPFWFCERNNISQYWYDDQLP